MSRKKKKWLTLVAALMAAVAAVFQPQLLPVVDAAAEAVGVEPAL